MRGIILGVFLGIWITILLALVEKYRMSDYLLWVFIGVSVILILLSLWRVILRLIAKHWPRFYIWINEFNSSIPITDEYRRKAYKKVDKNAENQTTTK